MQEFLIIILAFPFDPRTLFIFQKQLYNLTIIKILEMHTPIKQKRSRRVMTTAYTEQPIATNTLERSKYKNSELSSFNELFTDMNRKLKFQELAESRLYQFKAKRLVKDTQKGYRKTMLTYLDSKFSQFYPAKQTAKQPLLQKSNMREIQQLSKQQHSKIKVLFSSYMDVIRQERIKSLSEYGLGLVLKQTNFINSLLYQRQTVILLWKQLEQPNIGELFVFICVLYFHVEKLLLHSQTHLIAIVQELFNELGFKFSLQRLEITLERSKLVLRDNKLKFKLLNNRQNRHTISSLNRHKQRL